MKKTTSVLLAMVATALLAGCPDNKPAPGGAASASASAAAATPKAAPSASGGSNAGSGW
jgi:hypothetical protein